MDAGQPTDSELETWARSDKASEPFPGWDEYIAMPERIELLIRLVEEPYLPTARYLEHCLYLALRHGEPGSPEARGRFGSAIDRASASSSAEVRRWAEVATEFLTGTGMFAAGGSPAERQEREFALMRMRIPDCAFARLLQAAGSIWGLSDYDEAVVSIAEALVLELVPDLTEEKVKSVTAEVLSDLGRSSTDEQLDRGAREMYAIMSRPWTLGGRPRST